MKMFLWIIGMTSYVGSIFFTVRHEFAACMTITVLCVGFLMLERAIREKR